MCECIKYIPYQLHQHRKKKNLDGRLKHHTVPLLPERDNIKRRSPSRIATHHTYQRQTFAMHTPTSTVALIGIALLNNLASGFCTSAVAAASLPPLALIQPPSPKTPLQMQRRDINELSNPLSVRGGALASTARDDDKHDLKLTAGKVAASAWGTCGVAYILIKAIRRVLPIALEPFGKGAVALTKPELG
jgi:hypothetical protein